MKQPSSDEVASLMRHALVLASVFTAAVILLATFTASPAVKTPPLHLANGSSPSPLSPPLRRANIVVLETAGHHDEVIASFLYTLSHSQHHVTALLRGKRFGAQQLYDGMLPTGRVEFDNVDALASYKSADVIVSVTCDTDLRSASGALDKLLAETEVRIFCVAHKEDQWRLAREEMKKAQPWLRAGRLQWLVLSPHVRRSLLASEGHARPPTGGGNVFRGAHIDVWPPVFPSPVQDVRAEMGLKPGDAAFAIQGNFDPGRRGYDGVFTKWAKLKQVNSPERSKAKLVLAGSGKAMELAPAIRDSVSVQLNLDYVPFYSTLHHSRALLPAFIADDYYTNRASSTIGASVIAGVPLVASQRLLDAYQYVGPDDVYLRGEDETEVDAIARILAMPDDVHDTKKRHLARTREALLARNLDFVATKMATPAS